ncbi:MAG: DMT family transporter [bacterium]
MNNQCNTTSGNLKITDRPLLAFSLLLLSAFIFSITAALVKAGAHSASVGQLVFCRFFLGLLAIQAARTVGLVRFNAVNRKGLLLRGLFGGVAVVCFFLAVYYGTITHGVILNSSYPVFVAMFSFLYIGERLRGVVVFPLAAAIIGVALIVKPQAGAVQWADLAGLLSGISAGFAILTVRKLRETDSPLAVVYFFNVTGTLLTFPLLAIQPVVYSTQVILLMLGIAAAANFSQILLTIAYRYTRASEGSIATLSSAIFSAAWGAIFFGESLDAATAAGAALILGAGIYLSATYR